MQTSLEHPVICVIFIDEFTKWNSLFYLSSFVFIGSLNSKHLQIMDHQWSTLIQWIRERTQYLRNLNISQEKILELSAKVDILHQFADSLAIKEPIVVNYSNISDFRVGTLHFHRLIFFL